MRFTESRHVPDSLLVLGLVLGRDGLAHVHRGRATWPARLPTRAPTPLAHSPRQGPLRHQLARRPQIVLVHDAGDRAGREDRRYEAPAREVGARAAGSGPT